MPGQTLDHDEDTSFDGLDELIVKHFGEPPSGAAPKPAAAEPPEPDDEPDDTPDEEPEGEEEDEEEEEEAGDEELEDDEAEDDDEKDEPDEEKQEVEDVLENVTAEDHQRIKADPALSKLHKLMQRDYTRKTREVAEREQSTGLREHEISQFESQLSTAQGMADYLADTFKRKPDVVGAAFEAVATGQNGIAFLVEVGLQNTDALEKAYERVQEILGDEGERQRHLRERDLKVKEADLARKEERNRSARFNTDFMALMKTAEKEAKRLGIEKDDVPEVLALLNERLRGRVQADGSIDLSRKDVRAAATKVKETLDRQFERARQQLEQKQSKESLESAKKKALKARERNRVPPGSPPRKPPEQREPFQVPEGMDPLDAFTDAYFGVEK